MKAPETYVVVYGEQGNFSSQFADLTTDFKEAHEKWELYQAQDLACILYDSKLKELERHISVITDYSKLKIHCTNGHVMQYFDRLAVEKYFANPYNT